MKRSVYIALGLLAVTATAWAGTIVTGYGPTRADAVDDAERKASRLAKQKGTCYEYVDASRCTQSNGEWVCQADVANHRGSCGGSDKIIP